MHATANVTIEGAPMTLSAEMKYMSPNKESMEMSMEGMGVIMKQKFNGDAGYAEQQGMKRPFSEKELADKKAENVLFPEMYYTSENVSLETLTSIEGKDVYKLKVELNGNPSFRYYDAETGFLVQAEREAEAQGQKITSTSKYSNYSEVDGVKFPYYISINSGPQTILMNFNNVKINDGVTEADFE